MRGKTKLKLQQRCRKRESGHEELRFVVHCMETTSRAFFFFFWWVVITALCEIKLVTQGLIFFSLKVV